MAKQIVALIICLAMCQIVFCQDDCKPRLIRLLIGDRYADDSSPYTATIMYQTYKECSQSGIVFPSGDYYQTNVQSLHSQWNDTFCHGKKKNCEVVVYDQFIHTVKVAVEPSVEFIYTFCADITTKQGCIANFISKMPPLANQPKNQLRMNFLSKNIPNASLSSPLKILFFGDHDLSSVGAITFKAIFKTLETTQFDAFLFLGDYGYEFYQNNGQVGDEYIDTLTNVNIAAPMAITAGNHEDNFNFKFFNEKFQMPSFNETQNNYYSFEIGKDIFIKQLLMQANDAYLHLLLQILNAFRQFITFQYQMCHKKVKEKGINKLKQTQNCLTNRRFRFVILINYTFSIRIWRQLIKEIPIFILKLSSLDYLPDLKKSKIYIQFTNQNLIETSIKNLMITHKFTIQIRYFLFQV